MSKSNIKELTKSPFKGTNTDKYDKYFDKLKSVFDKFKNKPLGELEENLFAELEKLKFRTKDPIELHIYGTILDSNHYYGYAEMFLDKAYDLGYNVFENKMTELTGDDITIHWIGLPTGRGTIGRFVVAPEVREQLEDDFKGEISIDFYDENVPTHELSTYQDIIDAMKASEFGGILFTEAWNLPKDIAIDLLPKIKKQKEENGSFTVKDLENIMLTNGSSLKLLDDTISELVNMDFDFDTEDEDDNDYTIQENSREATGLEKEVFVYLNDLRSSGVTNMYGAVPYIMDEYPEINKQEAIKLLTTWMKNFNEEGDYVIINEGLDKSRVKEMRQEIKKEFPNIKFSITSNYNSITVSILQSDINFLKNATREGGHYQVNHYYIARNFENQPEAKEVLQRIYEIISADNYIVSEDGDYGSIPNYYITIQIGKWDRPFVYTGVEDGEEDTIQESITTKQDKIDYILFYHNRDKSELQNMSDAVIDKIYKTTLKDVTGEIEEETFGVDTDNLSEIGDGETNAEINNTIEDEVLAGIMSEEEFLNNAEEFNESAFGVVTQKGFKVKNIHKNISEKKFISETIQEAYKQYQSFMRLYEEVEEEEVLEPEVKKYPKLRSVTVKYDGGAVINTSMAANLTDEEIRDYFKIGSIFDVGTYPEERMQSVEEVIINEGFVDRLIVNDVDGLREKITTDLNTTDEYINTVVGNLAFDLHTYEIETDNESFIELCDELDLPEEYLIDKINSIILDNKNMFESKKTINESFKQVMPYQEESNKPWIIYPDSVEAPEKEDFDFVAVKNLIASDNFLRYAYENLMTGEFYKDMQVIYDTYIKSDEVMQNKLKTFESYTKYTIDETLKKSVVATLILENMTSEITNEVKRQIYINLNNLNEIYNEIKQNIAISTPQYSYDLNEAFKGNIKDTLKAFRDNKIVLKSFNEGNVLNYNNNSINALETTLKQVSELFTTNSLELNSELSVVTSLALLQII